MARVTGELAETLAVTAGAYLETLEARGLKPSTVDLAELPLRRLVRALARRGVVTAAELDQEAVLGHVAELLRRGASAHSVMKTSWELRRFTRWLADEGLTLGDAGAKLPRGKRSAGLRRVLSEQEVARVYRATRGRAPLQQRDRAILEVLYGGGLRRAELLALEVRDLDLTDGTVTVRRGKGDKPRVVPLPERAVKTLERYVSDARPLLLRRELDRGALLLGDRGLPLREGKLQHTLHAIGERAGIGRVNPHALRHAVATHLLRAGASIRHVQLFLGHASLATTETYTHLVTKDLRRALERAHPLERGARASARTPCETRGGVPERR